MQPPVVPSAAVDEAPRIVEVPLSLAGERLDKALAQLFPEFSRSRLQSWIEAQRVLVDGRAGEDPPAGAARREDRTRARPAPQQLAFTPEPVPLDVIYEDDALVVINKPAASSCIRPPAAGSTILNGLLHRTATRRPARGIVHRLDKETSGLMVVARTLAAQTDLVRQLQARTVKRRYFALVWGTMPEARSTRRSAAIRATHCACAVVTGHRASPRAHRRAR